MASLVDEPDYSIFDNKNGLSEDMKFLACMPELCDVTFLVGETREPVCAVKAVLAARSRVFHKMLCSQNQPPVNPSSKGKKDSAKEPKLKLFLKRSSEPSLVVPGGQIQLQAHQTLVVDEFEPDVFRQLIEYIHTGCVTLQARTLLGVMNAADYYGLEELRRACLGFVQCCINVDTVCALLASAEKYIQYKCTKSLVQKVLEFVDLHGNEVLGMGSFTLLPQHVVRLVLSREELKADELTKFQAALMWSKRYCDSTPELCLKEVMSNFLEFIEFHRIPAGVLMKEVHPLMVVPDHIIMNALAYQADPNSVDISKLHGSASNRSVRRGHHHHHQQQQQQQQQKQSRHKGKQQQGQAASQQQQRAGSLSVADAHDALMHSSSTTLSSYTGSSDLDSGRASNPEVSPLVPRKGP